MFPNPSTGNVPGGPFWGQPIAGQGDNSMTADLASITNFLPNQGLQQEQFGQGVIGAGLSADQAALGAFSAPLAYYSKILGGNAAEMESAVAPERKSILDQYRAARKKTAALSPRSGGTNEATAASDYSQAGDVAALLQKLRPQAAAGETAAAQGIAGVAANEAEIGVKEQALGQANIFQTLQSLLTQRGQNVSKDISNLGDLTSGLETMFTALI
jgi:hypothetical protein